MTTYLVYDAPGSDPDGARTRFVAQRFSLLAALVPPVFLILNRRWLWLALYVVAGLALGLASLAIGPFANTLMLAMSAILGLEAPRLIGTGLTRRGYVESGLVVAASQDEAERRYFADRLAPAIVTAPPVPMVLPAAPTGIIGLAGLTGR
jgi:hypothetical protein